MNDTHGEQGEGWYGFDLDGTLAKYDGWKGIDHIGEPVKPMVELIKRMHDEGKVVKILTARVAPRSNIERRTNPYLDEHWCIPSPDEMPWAVHKKEWTALEFIQDWCWRNLGFVPEITHQKDHLMLELYDDRVKQVVPNEGWLVEDIAASKRQRIVVDRVEVVDAKWWDRLTWFSLGTVLMTVLFVVLQAIFARVKPLPEATENLDRAIHEFMESQREARE